MSRQIFASMIVSTTLISGIILLKSPHSPLNNASAAANVSVWWPAPGVSLTGVQPFKALVENLSVQDYKMYWQVDHGQLNAMDTNYTDYPHKEASVDLSGWKWQSSGAYAINFVAKDNNGNVIGEMPMTIYAGKPDAAPLLQQNSAVSPLPVAAVVPLVPIAPSVPAVITAPAPLPAIQSVPTSGMVNIWWPTDGVTVSGTQPFKAMMENMSADSYQMYWQVDSGQLNAMSTNNTDYPHKEVSVDLTGWSWKGTGPYQISFVAKNINGNEISRKSITIYTGAHSGSIPTSQTVTPVVPTPLPVNPPTNTPTVILTGTGSSQNNPLAGTNLYVDANSNAARQVSAWQNSRPTDAAQIAKIAGQPQARWFGDWNGNIYNDVKSYVDAAANSNAVPVLIAYNVPQRDCGSYSAGGTSNASAYDSWMQSLASGIGNRKAVVVLEPDALAMTNCLSANDASARYSLIQHAVSTLKSLGHTAVYIDAGNPNWISAADMAQRLKQANIAQADGFSLNVSNFYQTQDNVNYGNQVSSLTGGKHFIVDTSRNGLGSNGQWCNPSGRALGQRPTVQTGNAAADAFLWLKSPGESDGTCNGGPSAGAWWPEYALGLSERAAY